MVSLQDKEKDDKKKKRALMVLIRSTNNHCERKILVHSKPKKGLKEELLSRFGKVKFVEADETIIPQLVKFEESNIVSKYKFGILYVKEGQDENQAFSNSKKFLAHKLFKRCKTLTPFFSVSGKPRL